MQLQFQKKSPTKKRPAPFLILSNDTVAEKVFWLLFVVLSGAKTAIFWLPPPPHHHH